MKKPRSPDELRIIKKSKKTKKPKISPQELFSVPLTIHDENPFFKNDVNEDSLLEKDVLQPSGFALDLCNPIIELRRMEHLSGVYVTKDTFIYMKEQLSKAFPPRLTLNFKSKNPIDLQRFTLKELLFEEKAFQAFVNIISQPKTLEQLSALTLRRSRFLVRLTFIIISLNSTSFLKKNVDFIISDLDKRWVTLDFNDPLFKGQAITEESTIQHMIRHWSWAEGELRLVIRKMLMELGVTFDVGTDGIRKFLLHQVSSIVAPYPDFYYIIHTAEDTYQGTLGDRFNSEQRKQWEQYHMEINDVYRFLNIFMTSGVYIDFGRVFVGLNTFIMNQPYNKFISNPCSNNTFSKFLTVSSIYTHILWCYLLDLFRGNSQGGDDSNKDANPEGKTD
jgi:hypothetical protein